MKGREFNLFLIAIDKYQKKASEALEEEDLEAYKEARWKVKYFKDKIKKRKSQQ